MKWIKVLLPVIVLFLLIGCGKKVDQCKSPQCPVLMDKLWTSDTEAVRSDFLKTAGETTGIENLKSIKLEKDVKGIADAIMAKTIRFYWGKNQFQNRLVYEMIEGKGFLETITTGFWQFIENDGKLEMISHAKNQQEIFIIKELSAKRLVLQKENTKTLDIYKLKE